MPKVSILIPTHSMKGAGSFIIQTAFRSIAGQYFKDVEVIVSDQSKKDVVIKDGENNDNDTSTEEICEQWKNKINIKYYRNPNSNGGCFNNENNCIRHAEGEIIKYLDADDWLMLPTSLGTIVDNFTPDVNWLATKYVHTYDRVNFINEHLPSVNNKLYLFNTIGSPTCVSVRNMGENNILFDEKYKWMGDTEYFYRLFKHWGAPKILNENCCVHYLWAGQAENSFSIELMNAEKEYTLSIYEP